jgi:hypothetical protein
MCRTGIFRHEISRPMSRSERTRVITEEPLVEALKRQQGEMSFHLQLFPQTLGCEICTAGLETSPVASHTPVQRKKETEMETGLTRLPPSDQSSEPMFLLLSSCSYQNIPTFFR